jgi:general stress protein YciG
MADQFENQQQRLDERSGRSRGESNRSESSRGGSLRNDSSRSDSPRSDSRRSEAESRNTRDTSPRGFAAMDSRAQRVIAAKGGRAAHQKGTAHEFTREEARIAGRKGGEASRSGRRNGGNIDNR